MKFDLSNIEFSRRDKEKGIIIPEILTSELAEDIGIHLGDGSLYRKSGSNSPEFLYSGHIKEKDHMEHVVRLKNDLYNIKRVAWWQKRNELRVRLYSYAVAMFYTKIVGFPIGAKRHIGVPNIIMASNREEIIAGFLRGLIDTDFSLVIRNKNNNLYPTLQGSFASKKLVIDLQDLFMRLGIKSSIQLDGKRYHKKTKKTYVENVISIHGFKRVNLWLQKIGFNNKIKFKRKAMGLGGLSSISAI